jgi:3-hexulose-6-phosphate synthase
VKFQLALDVYETADALAAAAELADLVHVLEAGTPLVLKEGRYAIEALRRDFPHHDILADYKIMDAGAEEAHIAFAAGASLVTVCACANTVTIVNAIEQAKKDGGKVSIDMLEARNFEGRIVELDSLGAEYIQIHTALDMKGAVSPFGDLQRAQKLLRHTKCAVAGGIGSDNITDIIKEKPDLIIVGGKIMKARDRRSAMLELIDLIRKTGGNID